MADALVERDGHVLVITMNRPHRLNALSGAMLIRMYDAMTEADADDDVRAIVLTGAGGNFSSGADLKAMAGDAGDADPGIDVAARREIYLVMNELAAAGKALVVASSDLPEVLGVADRIVVMREGRVAGELANGPDVTPERVLALAVA